MAWKIFYDDQDPFSSDDGEPVDAPPFGVQVIVLDDKDHGRYIQARADYYVWRDERWWGVDIGGLHDFLIEQRLVAYEGLTKYIWYGREWIITDTFDMLHILAETGAVKFGRTTDTDTFIKRYNEANSDPFLPPRTAWHRKEWRPQEK